MDGSNYVRRDRALLCALALSVGLCVPYVTSGAPLPAGDPSEVCEPAADGFACVPVNCSNAGDTCIPTVLHLDIDTGAITVVVCDCIDPDACHVEFGNATAFPVGSCATGETCEVFGTDTDNDGIEDQFTAACVPAQTGACCIDIDDGPIAYDTCAESTQGACDVQGGVFHGTGSACATLEACCVGLAGTTYCAEVEPFCCALSGGVPQGPGVTCDDISQQGSCGQVCGGIAYIPCEDPSEFCKLGVGLCCCDFFGVCTPFPKGCPDHIDPVCGCDGVTYTNSCEADAAGVSIDHLGPCELVCGVLGVECPPGETCVFEPGTCDFLERPGVCAVIETCPNVIDPVCGCDDQTYDNACLADLAGVGVDHVGPCTPICTRPCGDIDGSGGNVNLVDLATFAVCFGGSPGVSTACTCSDLNGDGAINLLDFATFSVMHGSQSTNTIPNCY